MADHLGCLCIVLHGHLPYVLHHGAWPHGEAWLYEAAAETYLPLLDVVGEVALHKARPALTIGLTPVLLEQLSHEDFKTGFVAYLNERIDRARQDRAEFERKNEAHFAFLAERWENWFAKRLEYFERIGRDIPREFAQRWREGHVELLTSNATHAYMPLLLNDEMIRAQLAAGTATSERRLGGRPDGMWLPECAYRPTVDHWKPAVLYDNPRKRGGLEYFIADAGITHFFVDSHMVARGMPLGTWENGRFHEIGGEAQAHWDAGRGWRDPLQPVGVASDPGSPRCFAFARHPRASEQVWSGKIGYPGAGEYLEFHRKQGDRGLRYHRVTSTTTPIGDKQPYDPDKTFGKLYEHGQHFCNTVRGVLREFRDRTGRPGVCVAPFDAELFGHWWYEGPQFLRDVIFTLGRDPQVKLLTAREALEQYPPDKVMRLPEGSWGEGGTHHVWVNDRNRWMWEMEYRAEGRFLQLLHALPWRNNNSVREMMERAARELLLLQASDWPFVIHTHGAVDYGIQRFAGHCTRFDRATRIAEEVSRGGQLGPMERVEVEEIDLHDNVFQKIDLSWWM